MSLLYSLRLLPAVCAALALLGSGCSSSPPSGPDCPGPRAAFHVTITAKNGPLPSDTVVQVEYGGGSEKYDLAAPPAQPEIMFCHPSQADAGASDSGSAGSGGGGSTDAAIEAGHADAAIEAGHADAAGGSDAGNVPTGPVIALTCDLWTNSAATINIQGSGYPMLKQELQAEKDDCGIKTVDYALVLGESDGGTSK